MAGKVDLSPPRGASWKYYSVVAKELSHSLRQRILDVASRLTDSSPSLSTDLIRRQTSPLTPFETSGGTGQVTFVWIQGASIRRQGQIFEDFFNDPAKASPPFYGNNWYTVFFLEAGGQWI